MTEPTIQDVLTRLDELDRKIEPIIDAYDSVLLGKRFIVGLAGFVTVVVALGGAIIYVGSYLKSHFL